MIILTRLSTGGLMDKVPEKKICSDCREEKIIKEFRKNAKMKDGYLSRCKMCEGNRVKCLDVNKGEYAKVYFVHSEAF